MITKKEGAEDACPSCKQVLVCREVVYKDEKKLQWQYDQGGAHFSYDFKSGKSACKESSNAPKTGNTYSAPAKDIINLKGLSLDGKQATAITEQTKELTERQVVILAEVQAVCNKVGIGHPATIGMIFNQVNETRRYQGV